jgi:Tfp pilus assembly protein PilO
MSVDVRSPRPWWQADLGDWRDIDWRAMPDWTRPAQRAVLIAGSLLVVLLVAGLLWWPLWQEVQLARTQRGQLLAQTAAQSANLQDAAALARAREQAKSRLADLQWRLPAQPDADLALAHLGDLAQVHRIRLVSVRAQSLQVTRRYQALPLAVQASGAYHDWGRFLEALAQGKGLMLVSALHAKAADSRGMDLSVDLTVLVLAKRTAAQEKAAQ